MSTMAPEQVAQARHEKPWYLVSVLGMVLANILNALARAVRVDETPIGIVVALCGMGALVFVMVRTWRMCRAIQIRMSMATLTTALSPFCFIIEAIILVRMYSERTGIALTFMLGDKVSPASTGSSDSLAA